MRLQDKIRREGTVLRRERIILSGDTEPTLVGAVPGSELARVLPTRDRG